VVARQPAGAILNLAASFQVHEEAPEVQTATMGDLPAPESLESDPWSALFDKRWVSRYASPGRAIAWFRMNEPVGADPALHACALGYLSDDLPTDGVVAQHPDRPERFDNDFPFWSASLDHAIWFHRPFRADEWHVHDFTCHGIMSSRGLAIGQIFTAAGEHVATVAQEVLLRSRR
jgi:acyl-CoA thioesterase-2